MTVDLRAFVCFGDVVRSRDDLQASTAWLRTLTNELEAVYEPGDRLAPVGFTQGDELQALLALDADPLIGVLRAALHPQGAEMRWAIVAGSIEPGRGPATERTGTAFLAARALIERSRARRDGLAIETGDAGADALLEELAPLFGTLLGDLTSRQREIARLMLLDGMRQADVAERLGVSRATISVMADRARIRHIDGLATVIRRIVRDAVGVDGGPG
jgi:hypothetical protein